MWSHLCHAASPPASATWRAMRFTSTLRRVGDGASTARVAAGAADMVSGDLPTPQTCHTGLPDGCRGSDICMDNLFTTPDILLEMQKMNHGGAGIWRPQVPPVLEVVRLRKPSIGRFQRGAFVDTTSYTPRVSSTGSVGLEKRACNLIAGARFEVNARGIIRRDDNPQTS